LRGWLLLLLFVKGRTPSPARASSLFCSPCLPVPAPVLEQLGLLALAVGAKILGEHRRVPFPVGLPEGGNLGFVSSIVIALLVQGPLSALE